MQQYQLKQSSSLNLFKIGLYCLAVVAISVFLKGMILVSGPLALLTVLLLLRDQSRYRLLKSLDPAIFTLYSGTTSRVGLNHLGDNFEFEQFRLFTNRWFLILQMRNEQVSKNIILLSDRFNTINEYLRFRYQIINMSRGQHVT